MTQFKTTNRIYGDFILKIDWRVKCRSDKPGVFITFSNPGADPWNAVKTEYELAWVQIHNKSKSVSPISGSCTAPTLSL
ncbi:MAG TPA: hypothetical protein VEH06_17540 [Candidatus Bathyarchaeia archaeon]|nr:hypothetical protein [Candidatus Bathyarchaeia archaeon]